MKTGIVLEGGAIRTIYSSGVCDALLTIGLLPDYVVGVSAGIAYGVSYVSRQSGRNLDIMINYAKDRRYMGMGNLLKGSNRAYFGLDFVFGEIPNKLIPFDYQTFYDFPGQVEAAVTNLDTGGAAYYPVDRSDRKFVVLQASCAMPLLFPIFHIDGVPCLDGGASAAIPYDRAFEMGCDRVCAAGRRCTIPPGRSSSSWSGRARCWCSPRRTPRASTAPRRMWPRSAPCGRWATATAWSGWRRSKPSGGPDGGNGPIPLSVGAGLCPRPLLCRNGMARGRLAPAERNNQHLKNWGCRKIMRQPRFLSS